MRIIGMIVDKKPKECIVCPLSRIFRKEVCGKMETSKENNWTTRSRVPDERCLLVEGGDKM